MKQILIIEDDITLAEGLCRALLTEDIEVLSCGTLKEARLRLGMLEQTADDFSANYGGITLDSVGITADSVKQVNVSNAFDFGSSFYVKDANTILISSDGVFFEAVRQ